MLHTPCLTRIPSIARHHPVVFSYDDAQRAYDEWGANCGPGALAAVLGLTLDQVRPIMGDFEEKHYTNPKLMFECLKRAMADVIEIVQLNSALEMQRIGRAPWPTYGLARVQWEGPWTAPGVPIRVRYRHTHWVGARYSNNQTFIFDINCICVGGWVSLQEWAGSVVPWLLNECEPKANGHWHLTHSVEVAV